MSANEMELETFILSGSLQDDGSTNYFGDESLLEGEGVEQRLEERLRPETPDEEVVEELLGAKLMNGFMLIEQPCPKCKIPLVKRPTSVADINVRSSSSRCSASACSDRSTSRIVSSESIERIPKPIHGLPFCVICESYVITNQVEHKILQKLKAKQRPSQASVEDLDGKALDLLATDTRSLMMMGEKIVEQKEQKLNINSSVGLNSPSSWLHSPAPTAGNSNADTIILFRNAFSRHRKNRLSPRTGPDGVVSMTSFADHHLQGKRLVGKPASQGEGVEMKLEMASTCAGSAASIVTSTAEQSLAEGSNGIEEESRNDDFSVVHLWKFVASSHSTAREQDCEVSLNEESYVSATKFANPSSGSMESEHGGDCTETEELEDGNTKCSTISEYCAHQEVKLQSAYDPDREECDDSVGSKNLMQFVSHSIHYIESDHGSDHCQQIEYCQQIDNKKKIVQSSSTPMQGEKETDETPSQNSGNIWLERVRSIDPPVGNEVPSPKSIHARNTQEEAKEDVLISSDFLEDPMEQTQEESERPKLGKAHTSDTAETVPTLEDQYCTSGSNDVELTDFKKLGGTDWLQQQREEELKLEGLESDSILKDQTITLEGMMSDDDSMAEISEAIDKIQRATIDILEEVKAQELMDMAKTETLSTSRTERESYLNSPYSSLEGDDHKSRDKLEATSVVSGEVDDDVMKEYTVRREIATKVLGTKMLQGYNLKETQCEQCGMPQMEFQSIVLCVVCPVLARKAKKELRKMRNSQEERSESAKESPIKDHDESIIDQVLQEHVASSNSSGKQPHLGAQRTNSSDMGSSKSRKQKMVDTISESRKQRIADGAKAKLLKESTLFKESQKTHHQASSEQCQDGSSRKSLTEKHADEITKASAKSLSTTQNASEIGQGSSKASARASLIAKRGKPPKPGPKKSKRDIFENTIEAARLEASMERQTQNEADGSDTMPKSTGSPTLASVPQGSAESHTSHDGDLCVASKAPTTIKSADARRKQLEAQEKSLLEEGRVAKEAAKNLLEETKLIRDDDGGGLAEFARRKEVAEQDEQYRKDHLKLIVETKRLETMERMRLANEIEFKSPQESLLAVFALQEERKRLRKEARRQKEARILEEARRKAELEARQRRTLKEAELIEALEREAARMAREAQEAVAKAQAAVEEVKTAKKDILANAIAQWDADTVAETEANLRAEAEDYYEEPILPSRSFLWHERWETLRLEGRSVMTRRLIAGWTMLPKYCKGAECQSSPLLSNSGRTQCAVCGGSGTGDDGAYAAPLPESFSDGEENAKAESCVEKSSAGGSSVAVVSHSQVSLEAAKLTPFASIQYIHEDFEEKRRTVSKEIGKRMLQGWTLLDVSCPNCVMPLLTDEEGENEICVLCGVVGKLKPSNNVENNCDLAVELRKGHTSIEELKAGCQDVAPHLACVSEKTMAAELSTAFIDAQPKFECGQEKEKLAKIGSKTLTLIEETRKGVEQTCNSERVQVGIHAMQENWQHMNEFAKDTSDFLQETETFKTIGEQLEKTSTYLKEQEAIISIGKQLEPVLEKTSVFIQPGVDGFVAMMADTPCSPKADIEEESEAKQNGGQQEQNKFAVGSDFSLSSMDSGLSEIGLTSSLNVPDIDDAALQKLSFKGGYNSGSPPKNLDRSNSKISPEEKPYNLSSLAQHGHRKLDVPPAKSNRMASQKLSLEGFHSGPAYNEGVRPKSKSPEQNRKSRYPQVAGAVSKPSIKVPSLPQHEYRKWEKPATVSNRTFEDLAEKLKAGPSHQKDSEDEDDETCHTFDSMVPIADESVIVDAKPSTSNRQKGLKKGAAAIALEKLKGKKEKAAAESMKTEDNEDSSSQQPITQTSSAGSRLSVLKLLTIDTSSTKLEVPPSTDTPMTPRSPSSKTKTSTPTRQSVGWLSSKLHGRSSSLVSSRYGKSSPLSSPRFGGDFSPRATGSPSHRELHDRLNVLLANSKSGHTNSFRSRSEPNSPAMKRRWDPPDYLIKAITKRQEGQENMHADPPAMVSNYFVGRRVARDPEDRSTAPEDEEHSLAETRMSYLESPGNRFKPGPSPSQMSSSPSSIRKSPYPSTVSQFPESPKVLKMKENEEGVTLVIPKDFDIMDESQLRKLILAAKRGVLPSPHQSRLASQGRIKQLGDKEIIDVIDFEFSDDEDPKSGRSEYVSAKRTTSSTLLYSGRELAGSKAPHSGRQLQGETPQTERARFKHPPSPGEEGANGPPSFLLSPHVDNDIVVSRMHPPSPGEAPFNGSPARRVRKTRPKVTPESMMNRARPTKTDQPRPRPRPRPSPAGARYSTGKNSNNRKDPDRTPADTHYDSRSCGSGSSHDPLRVSADHIFTGESISTASITANMNGQEALANMSLSSSSGSSGRYSHYSVTTTNRGRSASDSITTMSTMAAGLPPISPKKGSKKGSTRNGELGSFIEREPSSINESIANFSHGYDTIGSAVSSHLGYQTGVSSTMGRSTSFDHSFSSSKHSKNLSDLEDLDNIRVLNSGSLCDIEIARRQSGSLSHHRLPGSLSDIGSVRSTTFDGIISRIDDCKSKLQPALANKGARGRKMVALIEKLTRDAADVSTADERSSDDSTIPSTQTKL